jgi:TRAP-type uncharacterized transport system substrate-binding protein
LVVKRRQLLRAALGSGLLLTLTAHSPYRQWDVYRKTRLVDLVSRSEDHSVRLGIALAAIYAQRLPESRATLARARDNNDLVRLIAGKQLDVALMREGDAYAVLTGAEPYAGNGHIPLRALATLGEYVFLCRDDLPSASAYMLTEALAERWRDIDPALVLHARTPRPRGESPIPVHPGALEYYQHQE